VLDVARVLPDQPAFEIGDNGCGGLVRAAGVGFADPGMALIGFHFDKAGVAAARANEDGLDVGDFQGGPATGLGGLQRGDGAGGEGVFKKGAAFHRAADCIRTGCPACSSPRASDPGGRARGGGVTARNRPSTTLSVNTWSKTQKVFEWIERSS